MNVAAVDRAHAWHPFTPIDAWLDPAYAPVVIQSGSGAELVDTEGRVYIDGNSSIWTNIHGHNHPRLNAALREQLDRVAHVSFLGLTHEPGARLASELARLADGSPRHRVFFSDDGSTAMETALKLAYQYWQQNGAPQRTRFLSLEGGYHGDTVGAMSIGHSPAFHSAYANLLFKSEKVMSPACYRCPFNQAKPEQADARVYRKCQWQCIQMLREKVQRNRNAYAAVVLEPRVQGAAGMLMHPDGYLARAAEIVRQSGAFLLLDEVLTGFGRTGALLACQKERVIPDLLALAKGLTGGYLPLAATLATEQIFEGFRGGPERTFFHGHSYTANPLGCVAALTSLQIFRGENTLGGVAKRAAQLQAESSVFWDHPCVGDVRQEGLILAVELVEDFALRRPFDPARRLAWHVSERARAHGLLTRGIGSTLVLMPPLCITSEQLSRSVRALHRALHETLPAGTAA
jgi:adenosylmethionine-8-amino-7-oxononanoate aminotransferase